MLGRVQKFLQPKGPRLRVVAGVDIDRQIWLSGDRIVIGSSPNCNLILASPGLAPQHVVFTVQKVRDSTLWLRLLQALGVAREAKSNPKMRKLLGLDYEVGQRPWFFSLADDPENQLNGAKAPRSGYLKPNERLRLGRNTELIYEQVPLTDDAPAELRSVLKKVPIPMSAIWAVRLLYPAALLMIIVLFLQLVGERNTTMPTLASSPTTLYIEEVFCALSGDKPNSPSVVLWDGLAECLSYQDTAAMPPSNYESVRDMVIAAYLDLRTGDRVSAASELRRINRFLGMGDCDLGQRITHDLENLSQGRTVASCVRREAKDEQ